MKKQEIFFEAKTSSMGEDKVIINVPKALWHYFKVPTKVVVIKE